MADTVTLALAGDTMLGRNVAERLTTAPPETVWDPELAALTRAADAVVVNLECCVSERGERWPDPGKPFFFRAPPEEALAALRHLGVDAVTLANNHALDYGTEALTDTLDHLRSSGIATAGAGRNLDEARAAVVLDVAGLRIALVSVTDHPEAYAADPGRPGVAYADLRAGVPNWLTDHVGRAGAEADLVLVSPHWGPNMVPSPVHHVRAAAATLAQAGAAVIAGHSAHVFHGVARVDGAVVLYDLGDLLDDYAVHPALRNDLGLLWLLTLDRDGPVRLQAVPLALDYCHTRLAAGADADWVARRLAATCGELGTPAAPDDGWLRVDLGEQAQDPSSG